MRVGHGFDAHRFCPGDHVVIGGVKIPHQRSMAAHSDGDVLIHAVCDALLGAGGLGDIGRHFPDTDKAYAGVDSRILLRRVIALLGESGFIVSNVDATVIAQQPRLSEFISTMCSNLADDMGIEENQVNVKATTTEKMGYTGRGEGIAAHAVVLIDSR